MPPPHISGSFTADVLRALSPKMPAARAGSTLNVELFIGELLTNCRLLHSIWRVGQLAGGDAAFSPAFAWDLVAFGDLQALHRLQQAAYLHREDVRLRVVTNGNLFQSAWGMQQSGSLARWEWAQTNPGEAYYNDLASDLAYENRTRYRAVRLWHASPRLRD